MSNVWTAIAFKVPCARRVQAQPLLQLFNGYAKYQTRRVGPHRPVLPVINGTGWQPKTDPHRNAYPFSISSRLGARARRPPPPKQWSPDGTAQPRFKSPANLEPAPTTASHTEGLLPEEEEAGVSWRDYDPQGGMPLPNGERSQAEVNSIFGSEDVDVDTGNYVLSVMYWRRQSGALIDSGLDFPKRSGVTKDQALAGLQYVRSLNPDYDEQAAGQRWAEEESLRLQDEIQQRSVKLGLYKRDPELDDEEEPQQGTPEGRERSSESVLRSHREEQEAKWEQEQAEKAVQKEREELAALHSQRGPLELQGGVQPTVALTTTGPGGVMIGEAPRSGWLTVPTERQPWVKYYEEQANIIKENILPQISTFGRLGPAFLVTLLTLAIGYWVAENYTPPPKSARIWPDTPPAVATLGTLTGLLGLTFVLARFPPFWKTVSTYMTIVPAKPNAWSLIGSTFRHDTLTHLCFNLAFLWPFGLSLHEDLGRGGFLAIYFACGAVGGFSSLAYQVLRREWRSYAFGNSACVLGAAAAVCALHPNGSLKFAGWEMPFAAWLLLPLFAGVEVFALWRGLRIGVDHPGHLGGIIGGLGAAAWIRWKIATEQKPHMNRQQAAADSAGGISEDVEELKVAKA